MAGADDLSSWLGSAFTPVTLAFAVLGIGRTSTAIRPDRKQWKRRTDRRSNLSSTGHRRAKINYVEPAGTAVHPG